VGSAALVLSVTGSALMPYIDTSTITRYKDITALQLARLVEVVPWIGGVGNVQRLWRECNARPRPAVVGPRISLVVVDDH